MKKLGLLFSFFVFTIFIYSCDKIENPLVKKEIDTTPVDTTQNDTTIIYSSYSDTSKIIRKILLEEFTGHKCNNCPAGHAVAANLSGVYQDTLILVAIHAGYFASVTPPDPNYTTDFNTAAGTEYNSTFGVSSYPCGMVSRGKMINNNILIPSGSWGTAIGTLKNLAPDVKLEIGLVYKSSSRTLTTYAKAATINPLNETYKLIVYITEDHVIASQLNGSSLIPNYDHRHALRDAISSGAWGDEMFIAGTTAGTINTKTYSDYVIDSNWEIANCSIVAYLYNSATDEIIQAEEVKIIP